MSNFSANILAMLDQSKIPSQIKDIEKNNIVFSNITINNKSLTSAVQAALDSHKFSINLGDVKISGGTSNFSSQMKQAGSDAGNNFANSFGNSIGQIKTYANNSTKTIQEMQQVLASLKFDRSSIDLVTQDLEHMNLEISKVTERVNNRNLRLNIQGVDELGRTVTIVKEFDHVSGNITSVSKNISQSFETSADAAKRLNNELKETINAEKLSANKKSFLADIDAFLSKNPRVAASQLGESITNIRKQVADADNQKLSSLQAEFRSAKKEAANAGLTVSTFTNTVKKLAATYLTLNTAIRIFKDMYKNVVAVDTAMTNLYKVTDEPEERYRKLLKTSTSTAKAVGRTVSGYIEQVAEWSKLGYSMSEAEDLSKISSIYANVGEIDDNTAVSDMVTALKGFNMETKEAERIADVYNELGNKFAVSAANIGDGVKRSAAAMKMAGSDLYETAAMITGISEITQNAGEAGNSLKIASMRIRGMKGELESLGEEVDENVDSISKVQTQILNLTKGKVNIFDDGGEFRNYYEIMKDISKIFNDLNSKEQASLLEILFGKMRGNQGSALIQSFQSGQVEKAYQKALESQGSAAKEQEKYMESIAAKAEQLKTAWQGLSVTFLNSDFLKGIVDIGTGALSVLDGIIGKVGSLSVVLSGLGIHKFIKNFDWLN